MFAKAICLQRAFGMAVLGDSRLENKERMTQMGHSHALAIFGKML
jgi:hypothetical protein